MGLSDMQVFSEFIYTAVTETIAQQTALFNGASNGAITLKAGANVGDYLDSVFYKAFSTPARRRDAYGSGAVTPQNLSQDTMVKVKVAGANGPFAFNPSQLTWIQKSPEEAAVVIGDQVAQALMQDYLNTAILGGAAAIANQGSLDYDGSAGTLDLTDLNNGAALFGDRAQNIAAWIMHSKPYHDLLGSAITNSNTLFEYGTLRVMADNVGRPIIITDASGLVNLTPDPDTYNTLGLVSGGITVEENGDFFANVETSNGDENIKRTWQAEYTYELGVKGYAWDKANGGKSPTDAELAIGTNWDQVVTEDKDTAGVIVVTQ